MSSSIEHLRHTLAHLLAAAVLDIYPDTKPTIGPAIDNGFYYAFFSLNNVPWGWVAILVILVLIAAVSYLLFNRPKI